MSSPLRNCNACKTKKTVTWSWGTSTSFIERRFRGSSNRIRVPQNISEIRKKKLRAAQYVSQLQDLKIYVARPCPETCIRQTARWNIPRGQSSPCFILERIQFSRFLSFSTRCNRRIGLGHITNTQTRAMLGLNSIRQSFREMVWRWVNESVRVIRRQPTENNLLDRKGDKYVSSLEDVTAHGGKKKKVQPSRNSSISSPSL